MVVISYFAAISDYKQKTLLGPGPGFELNVFPNEEQDLNQDCTANT